MLRDLHVRDLGVLADVTVTFGSGMTALTGETGAGKTLIVHALQLVLGGRAGSGLVRAGADEALVEARFEGEDGCSETVLARSVPRAGRSRAWIDGRMAPASALEEAGAGLVDIHGQHDHQSLHATAGQRSALDQYAGTDLAPLATARREATEIDARLEHLGGDARERARQIDLLRYQIAEIEAACLDDVSEEDQLAAEEERLADAVALREAATLAATTLDADVAAGAAPGAVGLVGAALGTVSGHAPLAEIVGRLRGVLAEASDVATELRRLADGFEEDPVRLEGVQARRHLLGELRRKYGDTLAEVVAFGEGARRALAALEGQEEEAARLEARRSEARRAVSEAEGAVRRVRAEAAPQLAEAVTQRLRALAMPDARVEAVVGSEGAGDAVELLLAANRGEPAQPVSRVASGGELSRTMLALRLVVEGGAPTMLFDEVDAGVGGAAALALARALREVSRTRQVLVVTHLAQVAAAADAQVAVRKAVDGDGRTVTSVEHLDGRDRVVELSRMLSGHPDSDTARAHAEELLRTLAGEVAGRGAEPGGAEPRGGEPRGGAGSEAADLDGRRVGAGSTTRGRARD